MTSVREKKDKLENARVNRERNRRIIAILGCMVVVVTAFALMIPAISITQDAATRDGGFYHSDLQEQTSRTEESDSSSIGVSSGSENKNAKKPNASMSENDPQDGSQTTSADGDAQDQSSGTVGDKTDEGYSASEVDNASNESSDKSVEPATAKSETDSEAESSTSKMPAQKLKATLPMAANGETLTVTVEAPEGALPKGTSMTIEEVLDDSVLAAAKEVGAEAIKDATNESNITIDTGFDTAANEAGNSDGSGSYIAKAVAVNITFADAYGVEIEPAKDVRVLLSSTAVQEAVRESESDAGMAIVHLDDKELASMAGVAELFQVDAEHPVPLEDAKSAADIVAADKVDIDRSREEVAFEVKDFSVYALVYTVDSYFRSVSGDTYKITLEYDANANIPSTAELKVREILPDDEAFQEYYDQAMKTLSYANGTGEPEESDESAYARFFDIEIWSDGAKVEPSAPVSVKIELADAPQMPESASLEVVHFAEKGSEIIEGSKVAQKDDGIAEISFSADSFSVYGAIVPPSSLQDGKDYMVLVKQLKQGGDPVNDDDYDYYLVENDCSLSHVTLNESGGVVVDSPMLWRYTGDHVYHHAAEVGFNKDDLPSDSYYRYIDPRSENGWSEDDENNTTTNGVESGTGDGPKVTERQLWTDTALGYTENHTLTSASESGKYVGVQDVNGKLMLKGGVSESDAVEILFASPTNVSQPLWTENAVGHIDISIKGDTAADVPLAFGKYYDENNNVVMDVATFKKLHLSEAQVADQRQLAVTVDDIKGCSIDAHLNNGQPLNDAFYVTGFSANPEHSGTDIDSTAQVRIEGSFKVAYMPKGSEYEQYSHVDGDRYNSNENYRNAVRQARLTNVVTYSVTVVKPVDFWLQTPLLDDEGNQVLDDEGHPQYIQLYDADGNKLSIQADVAFSASFDYWDERNECPPLTDTNEWYYVPDWQLGDIAWHNGSGMDFKLGGVASTSTTNVYALEVTKIVVDENGNRIKSDNAGSNTFKIYKKPTDDPMADGDTVKDLDVGSFTTQPDYSDYVLQHEKSITVGADGLGLVYDYDVKPALYYIQEDPNTIVDQITDTAGKTWNYKNTYILTEYAWRNHSNDNYMHVSDTFEKNSLGQYGASEYSSVPEILGEHRDYNYNGTTNTYTYTNDFLEYYVYNVYESPKVDVPVTKTWTDSEGNPLFDTDEYDWQATFKLQWAPLYPGEETPNTNFTDVTPLKTMTINKANMEGVTQELVNRYLADDPTLSQAEKAKIEHLTFTDLPQFGTDTNGNTYRIQYSLEETSYRVTNAQTGIILYSWSENDGYNDPEESTHFQPFYPHDAGETVDDDPVANESNANYYINVRNAPKNIRDKEYIDVDIAKQWDESFGVSGDDWYAEFELKRFVHTEYRDLSHMTDSDRARDPVKLTVNDGDDMQISTFQALPNLGLFLGCNFAPHEETKSVTFTANPAVTLANGSRVTTITVTAEGTNASNALVRSQEFFVTQDTVFTLTSGAENLTLGDEYARVLDTAAGSPPLPDRTFSQTIRFDNSNPPDSWKTHLEDLVRSETYSGDDDDNENVVYYEYYLVEKGSNPEAYAQYFRADVNGLPTNILSGDSDHQIEHDDSIVAVNGPSNRLIVKKNWRGVADTTGFPGITFTLYQAWADGNEGWVYENETTHVRYEHVELKGHNLEWICPEELPTTRLDNNSGVSRRVKYYVQEDVQSGAHTEGNISTSWQFYYYLNSNGNQTNAGHQGYFASLTGSDIADGGGSITICNKMNSYIDMDIKKKFFELQESGSWATVTQEMSRWRSTILGFKVIRAVRTSDGKWLDERGNESDLPIWLDYSEEMLCGYDQNGAAVVDRGDNDVFYLKNAGGNWHFIIMNNWGDATNVNAADSGCGLPSYGFYIRNGEDIPVEYWYSYRETNVYQFVSQDSDGTIHVTTSSEWDWFSTITPEYAYGPALSENGNAQTMIAFPHDVPSQDPDRISNFQASDLIIDKQWLGDAQPDAKAVYVKVWRQAEGGQLEDFTAIIAEDIRNNNSWQNYIDDPSQVDVHRNCLVLTTGENGDWSTSLKVNRALIGTVDGNTASSDTYRYYIQEIGYRTNAGEYRTDVNGRFKPLYDHWVGSATEGAYTDAPVGMNDYASNNIKIGAKGENRLKVINRMTPSTSYRVTKSFHGPQSSTGGQSSVTGKYPTDGSKQVVLMFQQRYRFEKIEGSVEYVSADNETWVAKNSAEAANTWTVDWQAAESASPVSVSLPLDKPAGSVLSDEAWYGSATAWSYTWEGLDVKKIVSEAANPENTLEAQLYYRTVEVSTPDWFSDVIPEDEQNGHQAIDDNDQTSAQILLEANSITNEREDCTLQLDKQWTSLDGPIDEWPEGFVVWYQLEQHYHLAIANTGQTEIDEDTGAAYIDPTYSYGPTFKTVDMIESYEGSDTADMVHPRANDTLENNNGATLEGLPLYGFYTASEDDVVAAREKGVLLESGKTYPVVYTYSARETRVTKDGVDIGFRPQTADSSLDGRTEAGEPLYKALLTNELVNVKVKKEWNGLTPGSDESATIKLYRFKKDLAPEPETTFPVTVKVGEWGDGIDASNEGHITVTFTAEGKDSKAVIIDSSNEWSTTVDLDKDATWNVSFVGDNSVVDQAVVKLSGTSESITEESATEIVLKGNKKETGITVRVYVSTAYYNVDNGNQWGGNLNVSDMTEGYATFIIKDPAQNHAVVFDNGRLDPANGWSQSGINLPVKSSGQYEIEFTSDSQKVIHVDNASLNVNADQTSYEVQARAQYTDLNMVPDVDGTVRIQGQSSGGINEKWTLTPSHSYIISFNYDGAWNEVAFVLDGTELWAHKQGDDDWGNDFDTNKTYSFVLNVPASGTTVISITGHQWGVKNLGYTDNGLTQNNSNGLFSSTTRPSTRSALRASALPLRSPASITWTNNVSDLPEGANPQTDEEVALITFSDSTWEKTWNNLEKYAFVNGECKEYVYYGYEADWTGASGATSLETTYNVAEDGTMIVANTPTYPDRANLKVEKEQLYNGALNTHANGKSFTVGLFEDVDGRTRATGVDGQAIPFQSITITNGKGETIFAGLPAGTYYVFEIVDNSPITTSGTQAIIDGATFTVRYANSPATTTNGHTTTAKVTNDQSPFDLNIVKVDAENNTTRLNGAEFTMYQLTYNAETRVTSYVEDSAVTKTTDTVTTSYGTVNGTASFGGLALGYYEIVETKAPDGYLMSNDSTFCIKVTENGVQMVVREEGKSPDDWQTVETSSLVTFTAPNATATVENTPGKPLPVTGGLGTTLTYLIGFVLMIIGLAVLVIERREMCAERKTRLLL